MGQRFADGTVPTSTIKEAEELTVLAHWSELKEHIFDLYDNFQFHKALEQTFAFIAELNRYTELRAPWKLAKSELDEDKQRLATTLAYMSEGLRLSAVILTPVMPEIAAKVLKLLGSSSIESYEGQLEWGNSLAGGTFGEKMILFPKNEA
jgi:methionyl-tRNA synthetase